MDSDAKEAQLNKLITELLLNLGEYPEAIHHAKLTYSHLVPNLPDYQESDWRFKGNALTHG
jgi:hypothetical protein